MTADPVRAVLFDLDGTLVATRKLYVECYARALEGPLGRKMSDEEIMELRPRSELRFLEEFVDLGASPDVLDTFHRHYTELHGALFEGVYDGIPRLLDTLRARGLALGLVTGKSRRSWEVTRVHATLGHFGAEVFDDDVARPKPDPEGLRIALNRLGVGPDAAVYVGDSVSDLDAAARAGLRPVAALWAKREPEKAGFRREAERRGGFALMAPGRLLEKVAPGRNGQCAG